MIKCSLVSRFHSSLSRSWKTSSSHLACPPSLSSSWSCHTPSDQSPSSRGQSSAPCASEPPLQWPHNPPESAPRTVPQLSSLRLPVAFIFALTPLPTRTSPPCDLLSGNIGSVSLQKDGRYLRHVNGGALGSPGSFGGALGSPGSFTLPVRWASVTPCLLSERFSREINDSPPELISDIFVSCVGRARNPSRGNREYRTNHLSDEPSHCGVAHI
jgi:hypothetical protein